MNEPYNTRPTRVNKSEIPHNNIAEGSLIRIIRPWREDELPTERNFPVAVVEAVRRTPHGFAVYQTSAGSVWFDRVDEVISAPAAARLAA